MFHHHPHPQADRLVHVARSQLGYHEGRANGHWDNVEKYAPQVAGLSWAQGQPWCDVFVAWCFLRAGLEELLPLVSASVAASTASWRKIDRFSQYPAYGAQALFGLNGDEHTGIVVAYDADRVTTIEGNSNTDGSAEGWGVVKNTHQRRDPWVYGYGYPDFAEGIESADPGYPPYGSTPNVHKPYFGGHSPAVPESRGPLVDKLVVDTGEALQRAHAGFRRRQLQAALDALERIHAHPVIR
jgi:hypothetical protein